MVQYCCDSGSTNKLFCKCFLIIIMVIFKCYFSGEIIALSYKKTNNNKSGVNIELGKTNRLKALCMMEIKNEINKLCVNKQTQSMKIKSICTNQ